MNIYIRVFYYPIGEVMTLYSCDYKLPFKYNFPLRKLNIRVKGGNYLIKLVISRKARVIKLRWSYVLGDE